MALTWDVTHIKDHEVLTTLHTESGDKWHPLTETLVWLTMFTSIGSEIDAENIEEFIGRVRLYERLFGPMMTAYDVDTDYWSPKPLTEEQIRSHLGLRTNVSYETRETWLSRLTEREFFQTASDPDRVCSKCGESTTGIVLRPNDVFDDLDPKGFRLLCPDCDPHGF